MSFTRRYPISLSLLVGLLTAILSMQGVVRVAPLALHVQDAAHCDIGACSCTPGQCSCMNANGEHEDDSPTGTAICGCSFNQHGPVAIPALPLDKALVSDVFNLRELPLQGSLHVSTTSYHRIVNVDIFHPPRLSA